MPESSIHPSVRELLLSEKFCYGAEVVTTRGFAPPEGPNQMREFAETLLADPRIGYISITDSPGGAPMIPPDWLAGMLADERGRIVLHLTCKDMNRNGLESTAWRYASMGYENVLALTGDLPTTGIGGAARGVFDIDSLALLQLLRSMNEGLVIPGRRGEPQRLPATRFFLGCAVSPFKFHERELLPQYFKLLRKIRAGAQWVIPQLGYDMRKFNEIKLLLAARGMEVPVVGNVYLLNKTVAKMFNSGKLAGCVVSDSLMDDVNKYSSGEDKGRRFFRELAARQLAVFKGLGFAAGYLGGITKPETFAEIIDLAESYGTDDWQDFLQEVRYDRPGEFFLFEHDPKTGLGDPARINPAYLESLKRPRRSKQVTVGYRVSRLVHEIAFTRGKGLWGIMKGVYSRLDKSKFMSGLAHWLEHQAKQLGYGCQDCGDCSLPDCAYLCPLASCSKGSRNGPCGGSCDGECEARDKECFWARVYDRLKYYGESESLVEMPIIYYNAGLEHTSSWANTYLDRDHHAPGEESVGDTAAK